MEIGADDLWAVEPASFVAERDALAKRLRAEGEREAAAEVKKRKRPPVSAWALNAVARAEPDLVDAVLTAGAALEAALTGGSGDRAARSEAQQHERRATDALIVDAATRIDGTGQQVTEAIRSRMVQTIRAAQLDPEVAERLRAGTLADDETPSVFGIVSSAPSSPRAPREARPAKKRAKLPSRGRAAAPAEPTSEDAATGEEEATAEDTAAPRPAKKAAPAKKTAEDKAAARAAEKAAREEARAARVALAHQQEEARRLAKRADRLEERARELAADAQAAADEASQARADADRAAAALADAEASADADDTDADTHTDEADADT